MTVASATAANSIVGARRVKEVNGELHSNVCRHRQGSFGLPSGTEIWQVSHDLQDLREHAFVAGRNRTEIVAALEARYPAAHLLLTRVEGAALQPEWRDGEFAYPAPIQYLVHVHPLFDMAIAAQKLGDGAGQEEVLHALASGDNRVVALETLTREHGPVLMHRDRAEELRTDNGFGDSSIVVAPFTGTNYALVKFNPSKAQARRTRGHNQAAKVAHAETLGSAAAGMRTRIDALSQALITDLTSGGSFLGYALPDREDSHDADDWEPRRYAHGAYYGSWSGQRYSTGNGSPEGTRKCLARLYALTKIHEKFRGRRAYRRFPQWAAVRDHYHQLPEGLDPERWGCWAGPLTAFWDAEMQARPPKPMAPVGPDESFEKGDVDDVSPAQGTGE